MKTVAGILSTTQEYPCWAFDWKFLLSFPSFVFQKAKLGQPSLPFYKPGKFKRIYWYLFGSWQISDKHSSPLLTVLHLLRAIWLPYSIHLSVTIITFCTFILVWHASPSACVFFFGCVCWQKACSEENRTKEVELGSIKLQVTGKK